jgi:septum formation protein
LALLRQIGIEPSWIAAPEIDETPRQGELPRAYARRMALEKLSQTPDAFVIAADTVVAVGRRILDKTESREEAEKYLRLLSGRRHKVYSAVAVAAPDGRISCRVVDSTVGFARLDEQQLRAYVESGEWQGKAGGYAIQGLAASFVDFLSGSYSGVVGLPLHETSALLRGLGWH